MDEQEQSGLPLPRCMEAVAQTKSVGERDNGGSRAGLAATAACRSAGSASVGPPAPLDNPTTNARRRRFVRQPPWEAALMGSLPRFHRCRSDGAADHAPADACLFSEAPYRIPHRTLDIGRY